MRMTQTGPRFTIRTEVNAETKRLLERQAARRGISVAALLAAWIAPRINRLNRSGSSD